MLFRLQKNKVFLLVLCGCLGHSAVLFACINTRYSRDEEEQLTSDTVKLIMGQIAHHGDKFFELQLETTAAEIKAAPDNVEARNDHAVAHLKLRNFDQAEEELLAIEESHPGRYRTHANLGVLYKKMGRYQDAATHVRRSLEIQSEGHLGLGDYYLRMISWKGDRLDKGTRTAPPTTNFLGIAYESGPAATATNALVNREYLETLIKADRSYPDVYLVLGDVLSHSGEDELAFRAYTHAISLDHPAAPTVEDRLDEIHATWEKKAKADGALIVLPRYKLRHQLGDEMMAAMDWVSAFENLESELLTKGLVPDFNELKAELIKRGHKDPRFIHVGVVKGSISKHGAPSATAVFTIVVVVVGGILLFGYLAVTLIRRIWKHFKTPETGLTEA